MDKVHYVCPFANHFKEDTFIGDENGEPFVVQAETQHWIPLSVIIFAKSKDDAMTRIKYSMKRTRYIYLKIMNLLNIYQ